MSILTKISAPFTRVFGAASRTVRFGILAFVLLLVFGLQLLAWTKRGTNDAIREALAKVQGARGDIRERNARKDEIAQRYRSKAPKLAGYIEQVAKENKLEISDSNDRQEIAHGKRYMERTTVTHIRKAPMMQLVRMFEAFEKSPHPLSISRLNIRKRSAEPNSFDVELGLSAFDRDENAAAKSKGTGK
jgi:general secretion pathway protein M